MQRHRVRQTGKDTDSKQRDRSQQILTMNSRMLKTTWEGSDQRPTSGDRSPDRLDGVESPELVSLRRKDEKVDLTFGTRAADEGEDGPAFKWPYVWQSSMAITADCKGGGKRACSRCVQPFHLARYLTLPDKPRYERYHP